MLRITLMLPDVIGAVLAALSTGQADMRIVHPASCAAGTYGTGDLERPGCPALIAADYDIGLRGPIQIGPDVSMTRLVRCLEIILSGRSLENIYDPQMMSGHNVGTLHGLGEYAHRN